MTYTPNIRGEILDQLQSMERQHGFRVLFACESGSRAWGFASEDSDYDVRFVYAYRPEWYLSIRQRPDSVDVFPNETLDFSGWDLRKALGLFGRSNGPLLEWLHSPIRYVEHPNLVPLWRTIVPDVINPRALAAHYLGMSWKTWLVVREGETASAKRYLYILRTILAARWVLSKKSPPPVAMTDLLQQALSGTDASIAERIQRVIALKSAGHENESFVRDRTLDAWVGNQLQTLRALNADTRPRQPDHEVIDTFFRHTLQETWSLPGSGTTFSEFNSEHA